jgi:hypothetical protein
MFRVVSFRGSLFLAMIIVVVSSGSMPVFGQQLTDPNLRLEEVASGLENPTAMAFFGRFWRRYFGYGKE